MCASVALLNPSHFEGWSTTVEEARALGVPMLLSDLDVHLEQAQGIARFSIATAPSRWPTRCNPRKKTHGAV